MQNWANELPVSHRHGQLAGKITLGSNSRSIALGTSSTVLGNRSFSKPMKMPVSSAVNLPRLKSLRARSSTWQRKPWLVTGSKDMDYQQDPAKQHCFTKCAVQMQVIKKAERGMTAAET